MTTESLLQIDDSFIFNSDETSDAENEDRNFDAIFLEWST